MQPRAALPAHGLPPRPPPGSGQASRVLPIAALRRLGLSLAQPVRFRKSKHTKADKLFARAVDAFADGLVDALLALKTSSNHAADKTKRRTMIYKDDMLHALSLHPKLWAFAASAGLVQQGDRHRAMSKLVYWEEPSVIRNLCKRGWAPRNASAHTPRATKKRRVNPIFCETDTPAVAAPPPPTSGSVRQLSAALQEKESKLPLPRGYSRRMNALWLQQGDEKSDVEPPAPGSALPATKQLNDLFYEETFRIQ